MLLRPVPSTVNVMMKKGEHKAGKCSSEKGIHLPKVTQLGSGRVGMEAVWLHITLLTTHASSLPRPLAWGPATADAQGTEDPFSSCRDLHSRKGTWKSPLIPHEWKLFRQSRRPGIHCG